ncbi:FtsX-like permease family protein [Myxococcus fulvus]|uniref:FtsX-like permease family protein n=2 Tax=Myxococcus fulvus TaxID=33 RepID=UPI000945C4DD|nr:FtsX-like permease family protein [Myxococcus fulvus]
MDRKAPPTLAPGGNQGIPEGETACPDTDNPPGRVVEIAWPSRSNVHFVALGARAAQVAGMVVLQSLRFTGPGIVLGLLGALLMGQVLGALLFEVSGTDPLVLASVCALLAALAVLASFGPARRAARVDPAEVLRSESLPATSLR